MGLKNKEENFSKKTFHLQSVTKKMALKVF